MFAIHAAYFCFIRIMANFTDKGGKLAAGLGSSPLLHLVKTFTALS